MRNITVEVFSETPDEWPLADFLSMINSAVEKIPQEFRAATRVELKGGHDESTYLDISYTRPETEREAASRMERTARFSQEQESRDLATYEYLKAKFR